MSDTILNGNWIWPKPDGEELDTYVLGVFEPVESFDGCCIAVVHRRDDYVNAILDVMTDGDADALHYASWARPRIFLLGLGRGGLVLRMFAMWLIPTGLEAQVVGDVTTPGIGDKDLLIA